MGKREGRPLKPLLSNTPGPELELELEPGLFEGNAFSGNEQRQRPRILVEREAEPAAAFSHSGLPLPDLLASAWSSLRVNHQVQGPRLEKEQ